MIDGFADVASYLVVAVVSLVVLGLIFVPLERTFPSREQNILRPAWKTDLTFFLGQHLIWTGAVLAALGWLSGLWRSVAPVEVMALFSKLAFWQQASIALVLGDLLLYWGHRLQHRVPALWRFHRTHHTATCVDWLAAYREHPLDGLYTRTLVNLPAILLGFPLETIAGVLTFRGLWAVFIHCNVTLTPGPLKYLLGSPRLHSWHHARTAGHGHNFANLFPLLDLAFGTYLEPKQSPNELGAHGPVATSYLGHLLEPFIAETRGKR